MVCQNISGHPSSSEQSFCPLLHLTCLQWVSVSLMTSVLCSNPLLSTFVLSTLLLSLWPHQHPSMSVTMLPVSILVFHGHLLVLQQALYLSYSETTLPQAFILPQSTLTFPSPPPCQMPSVPGPLRISVLCSDPFLSTSLCQQSFVRLYVHVPPAPLSPLVPVTSQDHPRAPWHPLSSAVLFVSLLFRQNPSSHFPTFLSSPTLYTAI